MSSVDSWINVGSVVWMVVTVTASGLSTCSMGKGVNNVGSTNWVRQSLKFLEVSTHWKEMSYS